MPEGGIQMTKVVEIAQIFSTSYSDFLLDEVQKSESQHGWKFVYVEQGKLRVHVESDAYILKSGEIICLAPVSAHSVKSYQGKATVISFEFEASGEIVALENRIFFVNHQQKHYLNEIVSVGEKLRQLQTNGSGDTACLQQILRSSIEILVLSLISYQQTQQKQGEFSPRSVQNKNITYDIIQYLNDTVAEPVKLQDLADRFSYSLSSIKRIFKKETGLSIIDYQNNNRIIQSKRLLESGNASIEEIAGALGFSNASYFSRTFKKQVGISPSAYRKSVKDPAFFENTSEE